MDPLPQDVPPNSGAAGEADSAVGPRTPSPLKLAIRKARLEEAERSEVIAELRGAETARLEMLEEELRPALADIPRDVDMFDIGLVPGDRPRLFIDMIGFVEMGRDRRTYHFVQATRYGRVTIAESERMEPIISAVVDYVARRLIEREKALAGDTTLEQAASVYVDARKTRTKMPAAAEAPPPPSPRPGILRRGIAFVIEILGSAVLFALVTIGVVNAWRLVSTWLASLH
ncbi:hypothetical protein [Methylovirgula sp. HY1]|uniref:hypothetical protein n=1 Tax=Methylovirgula sp. HY1 TaxID=2822761 RepID=UPI001C5BF1B9|nr:hypothetical protein [Methylovirgula sp. HY1]QXX75362.1 hypothetical protein MHY1_02181 [Methylovirgula sp. HY1]